MDEYLSEKEQIDAMRSWWKENGTYVIVGLVVGIGAVIGITQWRASEEGAQLAASQLFEDLANEVAENRLEPAEGVAADIHADYPQSIYSDQARLAMARLYMDQGRDEDAATTLEALVESGNNPQMQLVGRLRLAKILLYQGKSEEVLTLVDGYADSGLGARFSEVTGDAQFALGRYAEAEASYLAALSDPIATQLVDQNLLRMKISDLPQVLDEGDSTMPATGAAADEAVDEASADADETAESDMQADEAGDAAQ